MGLEFLSEANKALMSLKEDGLIPNTAKVYSATSLANCKKELASQSAPKALSDAYCTKSGFDHTAITYGAQASIVLRPLEEHIKIKESGGQRYAEDGLFFSQTLYHESGHLAFRSQIDKIDGWLNQMLVSHPDIKSLRDGTSWKDAFVDRISESFSDIFGLLVIRIKDGQEDSAWRGLVDNLESARDPHKRDWSIREKANYYFSDLFSKDSHDSSNAIRHLKAIDKKSLDNISVQDIPNVAASIAVTAALEDFGIQNLQYPMFLPTKIGERLKARRAENDLNQKGELEPPALYKP